MVRRSYPAWCTHAKLESRTGIPSTLSGFTPSPAALEATCLTHCMSTAARAAKAAKVFPRPVAGALRPVVHGQTVRYNMKKRYGRGFTFDELKVRTTTSQLNIVTWVGRGFLRLHRAHCGGHQPVTAARQHNQQQISGWRGRQSSHHPASALKGCVCTARTLPPCQQRRGRVLNRTCSQADVTHSKQVYVLPAAGGWHPQATGALHRHRCGPSQEEQVAGEPAGGGHECAALWRWLPAAGSQSGGPHWVHKQG